MFVRAWELPPDVEVTAPNVRVWTVAPPPGTFIDRAGLVDEVCTLAAADRDGPAIIVIGGLSGMGKSAVLRRCAAVLQDRFDVALTVDFAPLRHDGAVALGDVVAGLLGDLRVDERWIPADLAGRCRRYLEVTERRRVLLLLDGVFDAAQVSMLVPNSAAALVIVASELDLDELVADGALPRRLEGLNAEHGAELLMRICADRPVVAEPAQIRQLVAMVDGSPSAIRILAAQLRSRRGPSAGQLIAELEEELDGGTSTRPHTVVGDKLTELFDAVYRRLAPDVARLYRIVGSLPGRCWSERAIAAACGETVDEAKLQIADLVQASLLEESVGDEYVMPDLVRLHARRAAVADETDADLDASAVRAMAVVLDDAVAADFALVRDRFRVGEPRIPSRARAFASPQDAMGWFARRHGELLVLARQASAQRVKGLVWQLFQAMWPFYSNSPVYLQEWLELANLAVADADGDVSAEARMLCQRARGHIENDDFDSADVDLVRAMELARAEGVELFASVLDFVGQFQYRQGLFGAALANFEESLAINEQLGDRRGVALQSQFCGRCLGRLGRSEEALAALDRARDFVPFNDFRTASRIAYSRAEVLVALDEYADAVASLHDAIDLAAGLGQTMLFARPLEMLADVADRLRDRDAELRYVEKVVALHQESGSPELERWQRRLSVLLR
ncbi:tetratricopeptide repeat protein [Nocardia sp. CA2R105]|uniref:tetratricopeptide repeat protein n=1 Tax=Nocardia coffeae TaxID=2873381 RepID=UPI001CA6B584|nr:tetratricopeptide repeat protein [Nocardia coffeae]MBY8863881.1 tetratricopeptide repeat protein [Nocardia coffeae]